MTRKEVGHILNRNGDGRIFLDKPQRAKPVVVQPPGLRRPKGPLTEFLATRVVDGAEPMTEKP